MGSPFFIIEELYWELCEKGGKGLYMNVLLIFLALLCMLLIGFEVGKGYAVAKMRKIIQDMTAGIEAKTKETINNLEKQKQEEHP
jgi:hypothetical protein